LQLLTALLGTGPPWRPLDGEHISLLLEAVENNHVPSIVDDRTYR